jgi:hypothetical protein
MAASEGSCIAAAFRLPVAISCTFFYCGGDRKHYRIRYPGMVTIDNAARSLQSHKLLHFFTRGYVAYEA